ncbi:MAG TPA: DUF1360 domain-containing protein [Vicinamibacterales bacterium]
MSGVLFVAAILATWRITHLVTAEDGPWEVVARLRRRAGSGVVGQLMDCFYCLSFWVALPFAWIVGDTWRDRLIAWPALSAGAIVIERLTTRKADTIE